MNNIKVVGGTISQQEKAQSVVKYCINKLMPKMETLTIEVTLKKLKDDADGYCLRVTPRDFKIEINHTQGLRRMLETVAHEMVHVKQYARNETNDWAYYNGKEFYKWKDKYVSENTDYWDLPWEIEANGMEVGLFVRWAKKCGFDKQAWTQI